MARFGVSIAVTEESTEQRGEYENLPNGVYRLEISAAEVKRKNEGTPQEAAGFKCTFDVIEPDEYKQRRVFGYYNIVNPSEVAQRIGQQQFSQLRRALGFGDVDSEMEEQEVIDEMRLVPFIAKVGMGKASKGKDGTEYPANNEIKMYFYPDLDDAPPIGVTGTPANDNKPTARVVAKPANPSTARSTNNGGSAASRPAGSKPWQKAA